MRKCILTLWLLTPGMAMAAYAQTGTRALFDLSTPQRGPFPNDRFTIADRSHKTGLRVNLPLPDCSKRPSDCDDIGVLNTLDGFNVQPRLSIPFDGEIDPTSVDSSTVFLIRLGSTARAGVNQRVWDRATRTLFVESDELLDQHTRYALIVTNGVRDGSGRPVSASNEFRQFRKRVSGPYRLALEEAIQSAVRLGVAETKVVAASVFTTQSVTPVLEKIRGQLDATRPAPADFRLGPDGKRMVFRRDQIRAITLNRQDRDKPPAFTRSELPVSALDQIAPGAVSLIAMGKYASPDYMLHPGEYIPPIGTLSGVPTVQATNEIYFNVFLPAGPKPSSGWPVTIVGHGGGQTKEDQAYGLGGSLASQGVATIAISAVGCGGGPLGTLRVDLVSGESVTLPSGGRGFDQDGDGIIGNHEGAAATAPRRLLGLGDSQRQTVADWMQLVRVMQAGMDVDGDGAADLDPARISYVGVSFGGGLGPQLLAIEPRVRVGVFNVPGGGAGRIDIIRLRPSGRGLIVGQELAARTPPLLNANGLTAIEGFPVSPPYFNENLPLRNQPPVVNDTEGAIEIQELFDRAEWASETGDAAAYAPYLRRKPLGGMPAKSILIQIGKGDLAGNPRQTAIIRAGGLADRTTMYRHDLAFAEFPTLAKNPHGFMVLLRRPGMAGEIARAAQRQMAIFIASGGTEIVVPEPRRFFEAPVARLPEDLGFIR